MYTKYFRDNFPESEFLCEAYEILEECYRALDESLGDVYSDAKYVNTARTYTNSLFIESANRLEDQLKQQRDEVEAALNGYLINYAYLLNKYRARIRDHAKDLKNPIYHDTYEYLELFTYPKQHLKDFPIKGIATGFVEAHRESNDIKKMQNGADKIIRSFTEDYFGEEFNLQDTELTKEVIQSHMVGDPKENTITPMNLMLTVQNMQKNTRIKSYLRQSKASIPATFKLLRDSYTEVQDRMHSDQSISVNTAMYRSIPTMQNPNRTILLARSNSTIAMMDMEYNRIFMAFAKAYYYTEACRLNAIKNKIEGYKNLATEIMTQLNLLAALPDPKNTNPKVTFVKR